MSALHFAMYSEAGSYPAMYSGAYPKSMETPHNKALFDGMYEIRTKLAGAIDRCENVSLTERTLGYLESAKQYADLANEMKATRTWIEKHMQGLVEIK